jgi:2OG-Fe(II) oxygenase superfamily
VTEPAFADFARWDVARLAAEWRAARPYPHVVLDGVLAPARVDALLAAVEREPHWPNRSDLYETMGSAEPPASPALAGVQAALSAPDALAAVAAITGARVSRASLRSWVYLPGSYLLPHSDARAELARRVAWVFYLSPPTDGGELELFDCTLDAAGEVIATRPARRVRAEPNRLVLLDVSPVSLHQVCEVRAGARASLAGWFYE